jgi:hypothetical protein
MVGLLLNRAGVDSSDLGRIQGRKIDWEGQFSRDIAAELPQ